MNLSTFHIVITFHVQASQFDELYSCVVDFLENEVSRDEGFVSHKFHTNKERTIFINYATWKSQKHYEDYKAKTGTVTERARKVLAFKPTGHEVWLIE